MVKINKKNVIKKVELVYKSIWTTYLGGLD